LQNILYKTLFATNFVGNTYKFYNFVEMITHEGNTCQVKFLEKVDRQKVFSCKFFKISCNMRISSNVHLTLAR